MEFNPYNFPNLMKENVEKRVSICFREIILLPTFPLTKRGYICHSIFKVQNQKKPGFLELDLRSLKHEKNNIL